MKNRQLPYIPIVMPRSKKYGSNYWNSRGLKVDRDVILYSDLEYDHWVRMETTPDVIEYCEQPLEINYVLNEKRHKTIFDMCALHKDGIRIFIEVKYEKDLKPTSRKYDVTMRQIEAQREWCRLNDVLHEVRTEKYIRTGPYAIENRLKILKSITNQKVPHFLQDVSDSIGNHKISIRNLCKNLMNLGLYDVFLACYWLYYIGTINVDLDSAIWNLDMEVWKVESNKNH